MSSSHNLDACTTGLEAASIFASSIRNKTMLITGVSRSGIGGTTALAFASQSPKLLILSGRNVGKVQEVADDITQKYDGKVQTRVLQMDLSSQKSVRRAAAEVMGWNDLEGLDMLVNNAGVMAIPEKMLSEDGVEMQFATNHLGHFLFTNLVRGKLIAAAEKQGVKKGAVRVISVTSNGHMFSPVRLSDVNFEKLKTEVPDDESPDYAGLEKFGITWEDEKQTYNSVVAHAQSKTANVLFSLQLQKMALAKYGIASFAPHPGSIHTELQRHADEEMLTRAREKAMETGFLPPKRKNLEEGCATTVVAATDPELVKKDGALYLEDCQAKKVKNAWAADEDGARRLWEMSERLVGERFEW
ncbi:MAG: hypothetical protein Q9160_006065 [Pyrenula sp. 1 TL-2023]